MPPAIPTSSPAPPPSPSSSPSPSPPPLPPLHRRALLWVVPGAWTLALGLWGLSRQNSVWRDEAATWQVARRSTGDILRMLENVDVVHGLYYLLMHGLFTCFGPSTTVLRLPSVLAMVVASICVTVLGNRLAGPWAGLGGGLAFGLLPAVQFHLQEGRPYALVAAGAGVSTLLLVTAVQERAGRPARWVAYGGTVLVCGLFNWLSLMILPAHLATLLWARAARPVRVRWAMASAAAVTGVLPLILFSRSQSGQVSWIPPLTWHMMIGPAVLLTIGGLGALLDRPRAGANAESGTSAGSSGGVAGRGTGARRGVGRLSAASVGLPLLVVPQLTLAGLSFIQPLFLDRYVLFSLVGLALLIGSAIGTAVRATRPRFPRASRAVLPAVLAVATTALMPESLAKRSPASRVDDVLAIAEDIRELGRDGDAVLYIPAARRDTRLVSPDAFTGLRDLALAQSPEESGTLKGLEADPGRIRARMLAQERILLVTDAEPVPAALSTERDRVKSCVLGKHFTPGEDRRMRGRRVTVYERNHRAGHGHTRSGTSKSAANSPC
ncbi:glycosyltransferase family 39 protein [Streptomyces sp. NPDC046203]|uniref:glycosyltransferase family 39 protein n=1 Tax=Streptomyces sp. NPDC046203 TaxID=3154602 RepID=UPI0033FB1C18